MFLTRILSQHRNDFTAMFTAMMQCEHCKAEANLTTGYNDQNYYEHVIPSFHCAACGKNRAGDKPLKKDAEGFTVVTVADIKAYLSQYPDDTAVSLDKDGWMCTEIVHKNVAELIKARGLFYEFKHDSQLHLFINN